MPLEGGETVPKTRPPAGFWDAPANERLLGWRGRRHENEHEAHALDTGGGHAVTIVAVPSLERFQADRNGKSQLTDPKYKFPTVLPDSEYRATTFTIQPYP